MADELKKSKPKATAKVARPSVAPEAVTQPAAPKAAKAPLASAAARAVASAVPTPAPVVEAQAPVVSAPVISAPTVAPVAAESAVAPQALPEAPIKPVATAPAVVVPVEVSTPVSVPVNRIPPKAAAPRSTPIAKKEIFIMNTTTTAMTDTIQNAMKDAAEKAKATLEKSQATMGDMSAFAKGNVEAVVEAGKILASGMQEMSKGYMTDGKTAVETMTAEIKDLIAVKSPAEFFEKQSAMLRKQFDATVAASSKNSEAMLKLASEAFQPISNRVSLAVEKIKHAA